MEHIKSVIDNKADKIRTEYLREIVDLAQKNMDSEGFILDERTGLEYEHKLEELFKQIRYVTVKNPNNLKNKKFRIASVGKYGTVTLYCNEVISYNLIEMKEDIYTHEVNYDYLVDFADNIDTVEWVDFTSIVKDKSLLRQQNSIKAVLELMLI